MEINNRKAKEIDRYDIAMCIAEAFEQDFSILCKEIRTVAAAIAPGLQIETFYVAESGGEIAGVLAISDRSGRAAKADQASLKKHFGLIKGFIAARIMKGEFEKQLDYPETTGFIEFVAVGKNYRKKGVATSMIQKSMELSRYRDFVLDVTDINANAIRCYTQIGFEEFKRVKEKHAKQKGFNEKIFMRYSPGS